MHVRRTVLLVAAAFVASRAGAQGNTGDATKPPSDGSQAWYRKDAQKARELGQKGVDAGKRGASAAGKEINKGGQALNARVVGTRTVTGKIADVSSEQVTLDRSDGTPMQLRITPATQVTVRGQSASAASLQRGDEVRASYAQSGGSAAATRIDVSPPAGSAPPATSSPRTGGGGSGPDGR